MKKNSNQSGFTISELLIVMLITGFFVALLMYFTFSFWRYTFLLEADQDTLGSRLDAGDLIREQIGTSSGMILQNSIADVNRHVPEPSDGTGNFWIINHAIPGNITTPSGTFKQIAYYRRFSTDSAKNYIMNGVQPFQDEYIIYLNGTTKQLLLRSLANPDASGNRLKTSCPKEIATASCPADKIISNDVASIDMRYFSRTGNLIDWTSITDPVTGEYIGPDFTAVDVLEIKINLTKKPLLQTTNATVNSTIIRVALRNY